MFVGALSALLYFVWILGGIVLLVFLIIFLTRSLTLKREHNELLKELVRTLKENKQPEE